MREGGVLLGIILQALIIVNLKITAVFDRCSGFGPSSDSILFYFGWA